MRNYHIFLITNHFLYLYKDNPAKLYETLNNIRKLNPNEYKLGERLFKQICLPVNIKKVNEYIYNRHKKELAYTRINNNHIYRNIYINDISKMIVRKTQVKISSNKNISIFLKDLKDYSNFFFVCDFINCDYFLLSLIEEETLAK